MTATEDETAAPADDRIEALDNDPEDTPLVERDHEGDTAEPVGQTAGDGSGPPTPAAAPGAAEDDSARAAELAAYDAETHGLVTALVEDIRDLARRLDAAKRHAKTLKDTLDEQNLALLMLWEERRAGRGRRPQPDLFAGLSNVPADGWRGLPLSALKLPDDIAVPMDDDGIKTVGQLAEHIAKDEDGLSDERRAVVKAEIEAAARGERNPPAPEPDKPDPLAELWRQFPIKRWVEFGLTDTDVKKLAECEVKRSGERFPIVTVGDLNRFVQPNPGMPEFTRGYGDIKGFGQAGTDRLSEAETRFWAEWNKGLKDAFTMEKGVQG